MSMEKMLIEIEIEEVLFEMLKKMRSIFFFTSVLLIMGIFFISNVPVFSAPDITLKVTNYFGVDHPVNNNLKEIFKKIVEEQTNGEITVQIYPANQLGSEEEFCEGVMIGNIEMAVTGNMWEMFNEEISFVQLPYIFVNMHHAYDAMNGPVGELVYKQLFNPIGIEVLGFFSQGGRALSNTVRPIETPEDCKGINMRTWAGTTIIEIMERFGFNVVVMAMDELFTSLQQGVVDAQDNPVSATYYNGWFEVLKYVSMTNHIVAPNYFVINQGVLDSLKPEQQEIVRNAAAKTTEKIHIDVLREEEEVLEIIQKELGVKVTYPDIEAFIEKVTPMIDDFTTKFPNTLKLIEQIQEKGVDFL